MARVGGATVRRMRAAFFIDQSWGSPSSTRYWVLVVLAAVIAGAGVVSDSTATVIGAMIVAPLMTPIIGCALAVVLADRPRLVRCLLLMLGGSVTVVVVGYLMASVTYHPDAFANNSQIASRISPRLIDLLAALATGTVGAFASVRTDISETVPGVAIAISLVPPLTVTGLLINVHRFYDAGQAALLFATNVAAIVATGTAVFLLYRVREAAESAGIQVGRLRGGVLALVALIVVVVAVPLTAGSRSVTSDKQLAAKVALMAGEWAAADGWEVTGIDAHNGAVTVTVLGLPPAPAANALRARLDAAGMGRTDLEIRLVTGTTRVCPPGSATCAQPVGARP